jgi:hypothetical protein
MNMSSSNKDEGYPAGAGQGNHRLARDLAREREAAGKCR